jgi:hypothetical protein
VSQSEATEIPRNLLVNNYGKMHFTEASQGGLFVAPVDVKMRQIASPINEMPLPLCLSNAIITQRHISHGLMDSNANR